MIRFLTKKVVSLSAKRQRLIILHGNATSQTAVESFSEPIGRPQLHSSPPVA